MGVIGFPTLSSVQTAGPLYFPLEGGGSYWRAESSIIIIGTKLGK